MNPSGTARPRAPEAPRSAKKNTPEATPDSATADDAGTTANGAGGHGTPAQAAMKQQSKTESERGSER